MRIEYHDNVFILIAVTYIDGKEYVSGINSSVIVIVIIYLHHSRCFKIMLMYKRILPL